jgi:hypothetical protein
MKIYTFACFKTENICYKIKYQYKMSYFLSLYILNIDI